VSEVHRIAVLAVLGLFLSIAPTASPADSPGAKSATWQEVQKALTDAGLVARRNVDATSADADQVSATTGADPYWYVWVFKGDGTRSGEIISGRGWKVTLYGKTPGRIYWTPYVNLTSDDTGPHAAGSWWAVKLYGKNLALVTDIFRLRKSPHPATSDMPGAWIAVDEALIALTCPHGCAAAAPIPATPARPTPTRPVWYAALLQDVRRTDDADTALYHCPGLAGGPVGGPVPGNACAAARASKIYTALSGLSTTAEAAQGLGPCVPQLKALDSTALKTMAAALRFTAKQPTAGDANASARGAIVVGVTSVVKHADAVKRCAAPKP
jgi:hypothetical protein